MGAIIKRNSTTFKRCPKDEHHPYNIIAAKLYSLNGYQLAIMAQILSNKDDWNLIKYEIGKRVGFPERKFLKAWEELMTLGYIKCEKRWGCYHYTIYEDPGCFLLTVILNNRVYSLVFLRGLLFNSTLKLAIVLFYTNILLKHY